MWTASEKIVKHGCNEDGKPYTVRIEVPCFSDDDEAGKRLNAFYHRLSEKIGQTAEENGCTVIGELHRAYSGEGIFSLYIDFFWYRGRELLACRRISDTRNAEGLELPPPSKLKRKLPGNGGWYYDGSSCVIYENKFTPGAEQGVRRSQYYRFFAETRFPVQQNPAGGTAFSEKGIP